MTGVVGMIELLMSFLLTIIYSVGGSNPSWDVIKTFINPWYIRFYEKLRIRSGLQSSMQNPFLLPSKMPHKKETLSLSISFSQFHYYFLSKPYPPCIALTSDAVISALSTFFSMSSITLSLILRFK